MIRFEHWHVKINKVIITHFRAELKRQTHKNASSTITDNITESGGNINSKNKNGEMKERRREREGEWEKEWAIEEENKQQTCCILFVWDPNNQHILINLTTNNILRA